MILRLTRNGFRANQAMHGSGKYIFYRNFFIFIGTLYFMYCCNRKIPNHETSWKKRILAVPYRKNKQNLGQPSADAVVENLYPITTILKK